MKRIDRMNKILDQLDWQEDDAMRGWLIDEAIGLADEDEACAEAWEAYR